MKDTIESFWDLESCFRGMRFDNHHLGGGDIRLTIGEQEEIVRLVNLEMTKKAREMVEKFWKEWQVGIAYNKIDEALEIWLNKNGLVEQESPEEERFKEQQRWNLNQDT